MQVYAAGGMGVPPLLNLSQMKGQEHLLSGNMQCSRMLSQALSKYSQGCLLTQIKMLLSQSELC